MHDAVGFFFAGAGTLPGFLFYAGDPGLAILITTALVLAGCVAGLADPQAPFRTLPAPGDGRDGERS